MAKTNFKNKKAITVDFLFNRKQLEALNYLNGNEVKELCFGGGSGGGKSVLGCAWILSWCIQYPGTKYLIGRKTLQDAKTATIATLFEVLNEKWKISQKAYTYNQTDQIIKFANGSEIIFKELDYRPSDTEFARFGGLDLTAIFIDEANQISEKCFNVLKSRIRYKLDENNLMPKILLATNPNRGWIFDRFYKPYSNGTLPEDRMFVPCLATDNPLISKHYVSQLEGTDEITKQRLLYGNWNYTDDATLFDLDAVTDMFTTTYSEIPEFSSGSTTDNQMYLSVDGARKGADKSVFLIWQGNTILECITVADSYTDKLRDKVLQLQSAYNIPPANTVIDSDGNGSWADFVPNCYKFVNNASAINGANYRNLRAQMYYTLAKNVNERKIKFQTSSNEVKNYVIQDLMNIKSKNIDRDQKLQIISKEEIKLSTGGRSTDFSDAMMMKMAYHITPVNNQPQPTFEYFTRVAALKRN